MYMNNHTVSILGNISSFLFICLIISLIRLTWEVMEGCFSQGFFFFATQDMYSSLLLTIMKKKVRMVRYTFFSVTQTTVNDYSCSS